MRNILNMKKLLLLTIAMLISVSAFSQTQKGIAKTKGRLDNDGNLISGEPLSEVTIKVKDRNAVMSDKKGSFTFPTPENTYYLEKVTKNGYVLTDPDILSKQYTYSPDKLVVVLETKENQLEERFEINRKIMAAQNEMISKLRAEVKQLKEENKITEEEYYKKLEDIVEMQNENQKLVEEMVDRYSKIDFDQMSEFDRQVKACILSGDLVNAKRMVMSKGDITKRAEDLKTLNEANAKEREEIEKRSRKLEKSEALAIKERDALANDYYDLFEIYKLEHKNDSAAYYLELRAALDTTNVERLLETAIFIRDYIADYNKSLKYSETILSTNYDNATKVNAYLNSGICYKWLGNLDKALEMFNIGLDNSLSVFGENSSFTAAVYKNMGTIYDDIGDYAKAMELYDKAVEIQKTTLGEHNAEIADTYNNIGVTLSYLNRQEESLTYLEKALSIKKGVLGEKDPAIAIACLNLGSTYAHIGNLEESIRLFNNALYIQKEVLSDDHPEIAYTYNNIGFIYFYLNNIDTCFMYTQKALNIFENCYGENSGYTAMCYGNMAVLYDEIGDFQKSLEYNLKALAIHENLLQSDNSNIVNDYINLGGSYFTLGDTDKAMEYYNKALAICENNIEVLIDKYKFVMSNMGELYIEIQQYDKALECYQNSLWDDDDNGVPQKLDNARRYDMIGEVYWYKHDPDKALYYYNKAYDIRINIFGEETPDIARSYMLMAKALFMQNKCSEALSKLNKAKIICEQNGDEDKINIINANIENITNDCKE